MYAVSECLYDVRIRTCVCVCVCVLLMILLLLMLQVSGLYRDPTLEDQIDYAIVRVILQMDEVNVGPSH